MCQTPAISALVRESAGYSGHMANSRPLLDVAIVGGGPAGLAAALAVRRASPDLLVKVYERSTTVQPRGAGLALEVNGLKALEGISREAYASVIQSSVFFPRITSRDPQGNLLYVRDIEGLEAEHGRRNVALGWWELCRCLQHHLPPEMVVTGKQFDHAVVDNSVGIFFEGDPEPVRARVLLGCDGYHSKVWQHTLGLPQAKFEETLFWRARVPKAALAPGDVQPTSYAGGNLLVVVFTISSGDVVWTVGTPTAELEARGLGDLALYHRSRGKEGKAYGGAERIQHVLRMLEGYPDQRRDCVAATDPASILVHGLWVREPGDFPDDRLGDGPVTVVGDAFHSLRPSGQGVSSALEDAVVLAKCIAEQGPCAAALRAYERERIPRVKRVMAATLAAGRGAYAKDAREVKLSAGNPDVAGGIDLKAADWPDLGVVAEQRRQRLRAGGAP